MSFGNGRWRNPDGTMKENWIRRNRDKNTTEERRILDELNGRFFELAVVVEGKKVSDWEGELVSVPELVARLAERQLNFTKYVPVNRRLRGNVCLNWHFAAYPIRTPSPSCPKCGAKGLDVGWRFRIEQGILLSVEGKLLRLLPATIWKIRHTEVPEI